MTEMDEYTRLELETRRRERDEVQEKDALLAALRAETHAALVDSIREAHSRDYSDARIAAVLGITRQAVNQLRLHGKLESNFGARKKREAPALDSAGKGQGGPV